MCHPFYRRYHRHPQRHDVFQVKSSSEKYDAFYGLRCACGRNKMNPRIQRLRNSIKVERYPLCIEKGRLLTESFKRTEGEPQILRRAEALAHVLDNIAIFIEDDELIVGNAASKPMGLEFDSYAGLWSQEEIHGLKEAGYAILAEEEAEIL